LGTTVDTITGIKNTTLNRAIVIICLNISYPLT
jgi:hypothetical protein